MDPLRRPEIRLLRPAGKLTTMPAKMMSEMPLPMPRSEICSPSHMTKTVPVVRVRTVSSLKPQPGLMTTDAPAGVFRASRKMAMPKAWMRQMTIVP